MKNLLILQKKKLRNVFLILSVCALSACTVKIKDGEWCGDLGPEGASCFYTLSEGARDLTKEAWDKERFGMLCTTSDNFANWKSAILKLCKQTKGCVWEDEKQNMDALEKKVNFYKKDKEYIKKTYGINEIKPVEPPTERRSPLACFGSECEDN